MKFLSFTAATMFLSSMTFGLNCPKLSVVCDLTAPDDRGVTRVSATAVSGFKGVNHLEPGLPADECEAYLAIKSPTEPETYYIATMTDPRDLYLYKKVGYGVQGHQMKVHVEKRAEVSFIDTLYTLTCRVN